MVNAVKAWVLLFLLLIPFINVYAWPIPDTGQTKCHNDTSEITCPAPGEPFYGQDGNYNINPHSYTKMDPSSIALSDSATTWAMVKDNVTGLVWENKTSDNSIHSGSKTFTWCDKNTATNGGNQGTCGTGMGNAATDTEAFIKALNDSKFGGFSDWRMPTVKELMTIADRSRTSPAVNTDWFPNMGWTYHWSSVTNAEVSNLAWSLVFRDGHVVGVDYKSNSNAVRAVRGGQAKNRYIDNGDGTITDTTNGLMWQKETVGSKNWQAALHHAETLSLGGFDDWRLPNINELQSLVDYSRFIPSIDAQAFPGTTESNFWSSTTYASDSGNAWCIDFNNGLVSHYNKVNSFAVRTVRGGQSRSAGSLVISVPGQAARWQIGRQKTISWDTAGIAGNVKISLSRQGGKAGTFTEVIAKSIPNNGSFTWTVTDLESINCALRIEPVDLPGGTTQSFFSITTVLAGDINVDKVVDLADAIIAVQMMINTAPPGQDISMDADVNNDGKIGPAEVIFILQTVSGTK